MLTINNENDDKVRWNKFIFRKKCTKSIYFNAGKSELKSNNSRLEQRQDFFYK